MVNAYNGWSASRNPADFGGLDNSVIPGTDGAKYAPGVRAGATATIAFWWGWQWHTKVEPIVAPGNWGFFYKQSANSAALLSVHAAAAAWDTNAPQHPNGRRGTLSGPSLVPGKTKAQVIDEMIAYLEGVVYSGKGAWGNGTVDEMHAEIAEGVSYARAQEIADKILRDFGPRGTWEHGDHVSAPVNTAPPVFTGAPVASRWVPINMGDVTQLNSSGAQVARDQAQLIDSGFWVGSGGADGFAGDDTVAAIRTAQGALKISVDGAMGNQTRDALHRIPSWTLPQGHVYGDIKGPANVHGGINAAEQASVKRIQGQEIRKGCVPGKSNPDTTTWDDGKFEGATIQSTKVFQSHEGLAQDGEVGPVTWTRLFL